MSHLTSRKSAARLAIVTRPRLPSGRFASRPDGKLPVEPAELIAPPGLLTLWALRAAIVWRRRELADARIRPIERSAAKGALWQFERRCT